MYNLFKRLSFYVLGDGGQSTLPLRIEYLEKMVSRLTVDKKGMEEEFGKQRKKFMQEMIKTESEGRREWEGEREGGRGRESKRLKFLF